MKQAIGVIVYKTGKQKGKTVPGYEERVLLDDTFDFNNLVKIFQEDENFDAFHILLGEKLILTTDHRYCRVGYSDGVNNFIEVAKTCGEKSNIEVTLYSGEKLDMTKNFVVFQKYDCLIPLAKYRRDEEVIGTTYNAFAKNPYKEKKKYTHKAVRCYEDTGYNLTKADALHNIGIYNRKAKFIIEGVIRDNQSLLITK